MVERTLVPLVIGMMMLAGLYAFDSYYESAGVTGRVVNTIQGADCSDTDNNNPYVAGVTFSELESLKKSDTCVGNDLLEFYCSEGVDVRAVSCLNGCSGGACN